MEKTTIVLKLADGKTICDFDIDDKLFEQIKKIGDPKQVILDAIKKFVENEQEYKCPICGDSLVITDEQLECACGFFCKKDRDSCAECGVILDEK